MALISEITNQNACELNVYNGFFSPPCICRTVIHVRPRAKDQESRSRTQGPCREPRTCSACMGIEPCRGQEPRTKEQESQGPRTKDHACRSQGSCWGRSDKERMSSACMRQTRQTRGTAPHAGIPMHAWRAILSARIESIIATRACHSEFFNRHQASIFFIQIYLDFNDSWNH